MSPENKPPHKFNARAMAKTTIEWCDFTFNPWWGCNEISPGCTNCYARDLARRYQPGRVLWGPDSERRVFSDAHWNEPLKWDAAAAKAGRRDRVFCASMADVFDKNAPEGARERLWRLIGNTPNLDWQLLTKRIGNAPSMLPVDWGSGWANVWLGITVVNQEEADRDIPKLLAIPAVVRFLSCEPLLGPVDLVSARQYYPDDPPLIHGIAWVIAGGESGAKARPSHPDWHRSLRDQCAAWGVPFLFKQWGEWAADECQGPDIWQHLDRSVARWQGDHFEIERPGKWPDDDNLLFRLGKKAAGRTLDGRTHDDFPDPRPA